MNENKPPSDQRAELNTLIGQKAWLKLAEHPDFLHVANHEQLTAVIGKLEQAMAALPQGLEREKQEFAVALLRSRLKERPKPPMGELSERNGIDQEDYIAFLKEALADVIRRFKQKMQELSQNTEREAYGLEVAHLRTILSERNGTQDDRGVYIAALEDQLTKAEEGLEELAAANQHRKIVQETAHVISAETATALSKLCARYIDSVKGYMLRTKGQDREAGMYIEPDEKLMQLVEKWSEISENQKSEFRRRIMNQVGASQLKARGLTTAATTSYTWASWGQAWTKMTTSDAGKNLVSLANGSKTIKETGTTRTGLAFLRHSSNRPAGRWSRIR